MQTIEGKTAAGDERYAIVVSRFNELVTKRLLEGAIDTLACHNVARDRITIAWVPGAFELPIVAKKLAASGAHAAVCCLGAVVQGETTHHEYINQQVSSALMRIGLETGVPVLFGVLTCSSMEQALARAGGKVGNKGCEAALAAIEMVSVLRQVDALQFPAR